MNMHKHFDELVSGNLALNPKTGLKWSSPERIDKFKTILEIINIEENKIKNSEDLKQIHKIRRICEELLHFYKTHNKQDIEKLKQELSQLTPEEINKKEQELIQLLKKFENENKAEITKNQRIKPETIYDINKVINLMQKKSYKIFTEHFKVNIVGVRTPAPLDIFNDTLIVFWYDTNNNLIVKQYRFTTDPGAIFLEGDNYLQINEKGIGILKEGQYINSHKLGWHNGGRKQVLKSKLFDALKPMIRKGKFLNKDITSFKRAHQALIQVGDVEVYRDNDGDGKLTLDQHKVEKGIFHINIHRANPIGITEKVEKNSAGCQVFADVRDYKEFIKLIKGILKSKNNRYTYTLLRSKEVI